jgi:MIP family channel proteins
MGRLFSWNNPLWPDLLRRCIAEVIGTWLMVFAGTAVVAAAVLAGAQAGLWQVAVAWAVGVSLAIYLTAAASGAHLNPAVSLAFAIFRPQDFPRRLLLPYWASQLLGAALAGVSVLTLYGSFIRRFEERHGVTRGEPGSQLSAMMFGEYFPNPGAAGTGEAAANLVSPLGAMAVEGVGTGILVLVIFALVDRRNTSLPVKYLAPVFIGLTVALLISMLAPLTQGGWNPARDFGPRLVSFFAGWGEMAIPGPSGGFWAYIAGPLAGGPLGAAVYEFLLRPTMPPEEGPER